MIFKEEENQNKEKRILNMWATGVGATETGLKIEKGEPRGLCLP